MMSDNGASDIQAESVGKTACHQCGHVMDLSDVPPLTAVECPRCGARFSAPGKFGSFVLLKLLGRGEMGATYKALDKHLGRNVAIKVMRQALGEDRHRVEGFLAEAQAIASLEHPNAVRVYSFGQEHAQPYIVMELIKGKPMSQSFSAGEPMDEARALEIGIGVARALQAAAEIGLIHGDVKPANIMLDERGTPKLVDFGIARFGGGPGGGDVVGTPYYVSPEQVRKEPTDARSDMYSLGATLFHALAGQPPFAGTSVQEVMSARLERPVPDVTELRPLLHPKTAAVVARMLQADPQQRHGGYGELLEDLRQAFFHVTGLEMPELRQVVGARAIPVAAPAKVSPLRVGLGVAGGAALLAAGIAVWAIWFRGGLGPTAVPATPAAPRQVAQPVFTPPPGTIASPTRVAITCLTERARIHYTTDGSEPTESSLLYEEPIPIQPGTTLRARAFRAGCPPSPPAEARYARDTTTLADVVPVRTAAEKAWQRLQGLEPQDGFAARLEQGDTLYATAEELYRQGAYQAAGASYEKLLALCRELEALDGARSSAIAAREDASTVRGTLHELLGRREANAPWNKAARSATEAFERNDFAEAKRQWQAAISSAEVELERWASKARSDWEKALAKADASKLKTLAAETWRQLEQALGRARQAEGRKRYGEAIRQYQEAAGWLAQARNDAQAGRAEQEKDRHLARARELVKSGRLQEALAEVEAALRLKPDSRTAAQMKKAIQASVNVWLDLGQGQRIRLVWVPAGKFLMGSPDDEPGRSTNERQHEVQISRPFYLGRCEVTRKQFSMFAGGEGKYKTQAEREKWSMALLRGRWVRAMEVRWNKPGFHQSDEHPVVHVSWRDAMEFCDWLSRGIRREVRLPTEAEWEYACRAGTAEPFSFGKDDAELHKHGNYADLTAAKLIPRVDRSHDDERDLTGPVGRYKPNAWGLYDMHGNVAEWCLDRYGEYPRQAVTDPQGPERGKQRLARGGSWYHLPASCRCASRIYLPEDHRSAYVGFRIVVEVK
jgi:formylglycine-generating enzyme required for sulfatase activity